MLSAQFNSRQQMKDLFLSYQSFLRPAQLNRLLIEDKIVGDNLSKPQIRGLIGNYFVPTKLSDSKNLMDAIKNTNRNRPRSEQISPSLFKKVLFQVEKEFNNRSLAKNIKEEE